MRRIPSLSLFTALVVAALLAGCYTGSPGGYYGGYGGRGYADVRGTVESVNPRDRSIVVNREGGAYGLRNGGPEEVVVYYDDDTRVEYQGRTYRPADLERGDRIAANVDPSGDRLYAQDIQVLYDVSSSYEGGTVGPDQGTLGTPDLHGVVRYVDTRSRTLEIEPESDSRYSTGQSDVVVVYYDSQTAVEYQGHSYAPENLERGDEVEIDLRDSGGGRLLAEQIVVVAENQPTR
jgi:hypothetical protein